MRISNEIIQQIQLSADIVEVVGDFVSLKKRGQNMMACCPFHNEKTPSFSVSPAKGIYKCFGCGKSGDSIKFVMDIEGVSYVEALKYLAKKYGIEIIEHVPTDFEQEKQNEKDSLYIVLNFAKNYYQQMLLQSDEGKAVGISYFKERGFKEHTIKEFELGYSTESWDSFTKEAIAKGYNPDILDKAGLIVRKESKQFDRFRARVIFPIHNLSGRVVAFGARILKPDKSQPKYLNSPETEVYHKSSILYGIYQAKSTIRQEDVCYLVEGYTDVISLHQAGIANVVASSGTSLTLEQIRLISRFTQNITVLYDGDAAGIKASLRGTNIILKEDLNVNIVIFPNNDDPDSYVRKVGAVKFKEFIANNSKDIYSFVSNEYLTEAGDDPFKRAKAIKSIIEMLADIPDWQKRTIFEKRMAHTLGMSEQELIHEINRIRLKASQDEEKKIQKGKNQQNSIEKSDQLLNDILPEGVGQAFENEILPPQEETAHRKSSVAYQEEESIRLLISYADQLIDEHNKLSDYILAELEDITFQTPIYNRMLDIFRTQLQMGNVVGTEYFTSHWDHEIQREAIHLVSSRYQLSDGWEKQQIYVPLEKDILAKAAYTNILRLKQRVLEKMMDENKAEIDVAYKEGNDEQWIKHMKIHMKIQESIKQVAALLGNVIRAKK